MKESSGRTPSFASAPPGAMRAWASGRFRPKVLHVIPSLSPAAGGPSHALPVMACELFRQGAEIVITTTNDDGRNRRSAAPLTQGLVRAGVHYRYFPKQTEFYKCSFPFRRWVRRHVTDFDVVHVHAIFSFTSICAAQWARRCGVPYILRPLGVLNRWGIQNRRRWVKRLSLRLIEGPLLRDAAAVHYTSAAERIEAEQAGATGRSAVIPLGLDLAGFDALPGPEHFGNRYPSAAGRKIVLFLSRIDPKKGLDLLLPAFGEVKRRRPEAVLVIAGNGSERYVRQLKGEARQRGLQKDVLWTGYIAGADKLAALAAATVFVLPSYSENFGLALVEALAAGLPCVTTKRVAVAEDIREFGAGVVVPARATPLAEAIDCLLADPGLRSRLTTNAKRLAKARFSAETMGHRLMALYRGVIAREFN